MKDDIIISLGFDGSDIESEIITAIDDALGESSKHIQKRLAEAFRKVSKNSVELESPYNALQEDILENIKDIDKMTAALDKFDKRMNTAFETKKFTGKEGFFSYIDSSELDYISEKFDEINKKHKELLKARTTKIIGGVKEDNYKQSLKSIGSKYGVTGTKKEDYVTLYKNIKSFDTGGDIEKETQRLSDLLVVLAKLDTYKNKSFLSGVFGSNENVSTVSKQTQKLLDKNLGVINKSIEDNYKNLEKEYNLIQESFKSELLTKYEIGQGKLNEKGERIRLTKGEESKFKSIFASGNDNDYANFVSAIASKNIDAMESSIFSSLSMLERELPIVPDVDENNALTSGGEEDLKKIVDMYEGYANLIRVFNSVASKDDQIEIDDSIYADVLNAIEDFPKIIVYMNKVKKIAEVGFRQIETFGDRSPELDESIKSAKLKSVSKDSSQGQEQKSIINLSEQEDTKNNVLIGDFSDSLDKMSSTVDNLSQTLDGLKANLDKTECCEIIEGLIKELIEETSNINSKINKTEKTSKDTVGAAAVKNAVNFNKSLMTSVNSFEAEKLKVTDNISNIPEITNAVKNLETKKDNLLNSETLTMNDVLDFNKDVMVLKNLIATKQKEVTDFVKTKDKTLKEAKSVLETLENSDVSGEADVKAEITKLKREITRLSNSDKTSYNFEPIRNRINLAKEAYDTANNVKKKIEESITNSNKLLTSSVGAVGNKEIGSYIAKGQTLTYDERLANAKQSLDDAIDSGDVKAILSAEMAIEELNAEIKENIKLLNEATAVVNEYATANKKIEKQFGKVSLAQNKNGKLIQGEKIDIAVGDKDIWRGAINYGEARQLEDISNINKSFEENYKKSGKIDNIKILSSYDEIIDRQNKMSINLDEIIEKDKKAKSATKLMSRMDTWYSQAGKAAKEFNSEFEGIKKQLSSGELSITSAQQQFDLLKQFAIEDKKTKASFMSDIAEKVHYQTASTIAQYFGLNDIVRYLRSGIETIHDFDDALTEMRKVSDESVSSLKKYQKETFATAKEVGTTALSIQDSTGDWMRLGESLDEASESAKAAAILFNVSEFESIDAATESLVAMSAAYKDLSKMDIIDVLNKIGNNFSISTSGLSEALQRSAASLTVAGNDLQESVALVTAGNMIVQNPENVGTGLRTIALRLSGTKEAAAELEELGEETDGLISTQSKLRKTILEATKAATADKKGVDILDSNGNYKSTYEILRDISSVYDEIVAKDEEMGTNNVNLLLETIAGKTRSNIAASILQNGETLREVFEQAGDAEGSALEENAKYVDSISGRIAQLQTEASRFWSTLIDSETVKSGVSLLDDMLSTVTKLIDKFGILVPMLTSVVGVMSFKGDIPFERIFKNLPKNNISNIVKYLSGSALDKSYLSKFQSMINPKDDDGNLIDLSFSEKRNIYEEMSVGLNKYNKAAMRSILLGQEFNNVTRAEVLKSFAKNLLISVGAMAAFAVAAIAIKKVAEAWDEAYISAEEYDQMIDEHISKYKEYNSIIDENTTKIEENRNTINQLSKDSTVADEERIKRLEKENKKLEEQKKLNEDLAKKEQSDVIKDLRGKMDDYYYNYSEGEYSFSKFWKNPKKYIKKIGKDDFNTTDFTYDQIKAIFSSNVPKDVDMDSVYEQIKTTGVEPEWLEDYLALSNLVKNQKEIQKEKDFILSNLQSMEDAGIDITDTSIDFVRENLSELNKLNLILSQITEDNEYNRDLIEDYLIQGQTGGYSGVTKLSDELINQRDLAIQSIKDLMKSNPFSFDEDDIISSTDKNVQKLIKRMARELYGDDSKEAMDKAAHELAVYFADTYSDLLRTETSGLTAEFEDIFKMEDVDGVTKKFKELYDAIDTVQSGYQALTKVIEEFNDTGAINIDSLQSLISLGDDWINYLSVENGALKLDTKALNDLTAARLLDLKVQALQNLSDNVTQISTEEDALEWLSQQRIKSALAIDTETDAIKRNTLAYIDNLLTQGKISSTTAENLVGTYLDKFNTVSALFDNVSLDSFLGGSDSSSSSSSSSSSGSNSTTVVDYLERKLNLIDKLASNIESKIDDLEGSANKNSFIDSLIDVDTNKISALQKAQGIYQQMADLYLQQIPAEYRELAKNGGYAIESMDSATSTAISNYQTWADKVNDVASQIDTLNAKLKSLQVDKFNNIKEDFESIDKLYSDSKSAIKNIIELLERQGQNVGEGFYTELISRTKSQMEYLKDEKNRLQAQLNQAEASGIAKGTDEWLNMVSALNDVDSAIVECNKDILEFNDSLANLHWDNLAKIEDAFSNISSEISSIDSLLEDSDITTGGSDGIFSNKGITRVALAIEQYELARKKVKDYNEEIATLNAQYRRGIINTDTYNEKLAELKSKQLEAATSAESEKDAIVSLMKARVDEIKEGIEKEIDAYEKLIQKKKEALQAEKELHDYKKSINDKQEEIDSLQRQINAMTGSDDAETIAQRLLLEEQLRDKQEEMSELKYDHSISEREDALDKELEHYKEMQNQRVETLEKTLENEGIAIQQAIEMAKSRSVDVANTLIELEKAQSIQISESIIKPWQQSSNQVASYGQAITNETSAFNANLSVMRNTIYQNQAASDALAMSLLNTFGLSSASLQSNVSAVYSGLTTASASAVGLYGNLYAALSSNYGNGVKVTLDDITNAANAASGSVQTLKDYMAGLTGEVEKVQNASDWISRYKDNPRENWKWVTKSGGDVPAQYRQKFSTKAEAEDALKDLKNAYSKNKSLMAMFSGWKVQKFAKGGVISKTTDTDKIASMLGENVRVYARSGERILTEQQNKNFEKFVNELPNLVGSNVSKIKNYNSNTAIQPVINIDAGITVEGNVDKDFSSELEKIQNKYTKTLTNKLSNALQRYGVQKNFCKSM